MTTAAEIITLALKDIQVLDENETPSAALMSDALTTLNQMMAMWQTDDMYVYAQTTTGISSSGALSYTVGIGGNFNISAPPSLDYVFYSKSGVDYLVEPLSSLEDYQSIAYKNLTGYPDYYYYNNTYPLSSLYLYPKAATGGTINIVYSVQFPSYALSADDLTLPAEYALAIRFSLAELLSTMMGKVLRPDITSKAIGYRKMIKRNNLRINKLDLGHTRLGHLATFYQG
jgi:hypothetical protein